MKTGSGRAAVREDETGINQCLAIGVKEPGVERDPSQKNCGKRFLRNDANDVIL